MLEITDNASTGVSCIFPDRCFKPVPSVPPPTHTHTLRQNKVPAFQPSTGANLCCVLLVLTAKANAVPKIRRRSKAASQARLQTLFISLIQPGCATAAGVSVPAALTSPAPFIVPRCRTIR